MLRKWEDMCSHGLGEGCSAVYIDLMFRRRHDDRLSLT